MSSKFFLSKIIPVSLILFSFSVYGKLFKAPYVEFNVEYDWSCKSFGIDWVCHHYLHKNAKPALILITAKEGLSSDNLNQYFKTFDNIQTSSNKKIHKISINNHTWVESFYKNGILKNMFSRYTATVCCKNMPSKIHILIGFHAHNKNYTKYASEFLKSIKSLRLSKNLKKTFLKIKRQTNAHNQQMMSHMDKILSESDMENTTRQANNRTSLLWFLLSGFILIFIGITFYLFYKRRRRRKRRK